MKSRNDEAPTRGVCACGAWVAIELIAVIVLFATMGQSAQAQTSPVIYKFSGSDGENPGAGLLFDSSGYIYGTTVNGGAGGYGEVFEMNPSTLQLQPLYSFPGGAGGQARPNSTLMFHGLNIVGTTAAGEVDDCNGVGGCGAVFELMPSFQPCNPPGFCRWFYNLVYSFLGGNDGSDPYGDLTTDSSGNIYGTARYGGANQCGGGATYGCGTVYEISCGSACGGETRLYSFGSGNDGKEPYGGVYMDSSGNLWGATLGGGYNQDMGADKGVVFELTPAGPPWTEPCRLSFDDGYYGGYSFGALVQYNGSLYGVSADGGMNGGAGTFFDVNSSCSGNGPNPLQVFSGTKLDLQGPRATLVSDGHGNFYGTTTTGCGAANCAGSVGFGTVFKVTSSGSVTTLYTFCPTQLSGQCSVANDGAYPTGELVIGPDGNLYGTTYGGGNFSSPCTSQGCGTIFKIAP